MIISSDYRILDINENLLKKVGLPREEAVGRFCYEVTHHQNVPCSGKEHPCPLIKTMESREPYQTTHIHYGRDKKELYYSISCYPVFEQGEVIAAIELSRDITKDITMQQVMMQQQKLASVGRLAAGVAHEINNPLTTILTSSMLIQEDLAPDDPNMEELQTISSETLRCRKIVTSLLNFARQTRPEKKANDVNDIVRESEALTRKQAAFKDVTMVLNLSESIPPISVDRDQLQQSLINLALNAIEATRAGDKITFSTEFYASEETVEIRISDTGEGIAKENLDKIFEPFFTTKETGTGLGIAITHGFIQQNGGSIEVESEPGRGTTFAIRFPVRERENNAG
jgi:signal transduction histidine kinase